MSPGRDYAPCPHCSANNVTYRQVCWRCGYTLPYTIGLDGKPRFNTDAQTRAASRAEIERLLNEAEMIDIEVEKQRQAAARAELFPSPDLSSKVRVWRRRERPSGA